MSKLKKLMWFVSGALVVLLVEAAVIFMMMGEVSRLSAPPSNSPIVLPWGAVDLDAMQVAHDSSIQQSIANSISEEKARDFDPDGDGVRTYDLLVLSGGGSHGAFGSGLLCGWTKSGKRPKFKIVTGISTGSLQAVPAFLGPKYDKTLRQIFTEYGTEDIYTRRALLSAGLSDSINDTKGLKRLIERHFTEEVLKDLAAAHASGRRLFVGTTNLDTKQFIIWDLGRIASSGRPDALEHCRKILRAACAIPVLFPPAYFNVELKGEQYAEMHVDGATYAQAFFRGFMLDFDDALEDAGIQSSKVKARLYVVQNSKSGDTPHRREVAPRLFSIASTSMEQLIENGIRASFYRIYVLAHRYGVDFNMAAIPDSLPLDFDISEFNKASMQRLFDFGYQKAEKGYDWAKMPPGLDKDEILESNSHPKLGK